MGNRWKKAFIILASVVGVIIIGLIILFFSLFFSAGPKDSQQKALPLTKGSPVFTITAKKAEITRIANEELKKKSTDTIEYQVKMDKDVKIIGAIHVFTGQIPFQMVFDPQVVDDGNVILKEKSVRIGRLYLPADQVLKYIQKGTDLPDWIKVERKKEQIDLNLSEFEIKNKYYLKAKAINLANDDIRFGLYKKDY